MSDTDPFIVIEDVRCALEEGRIPRARRPLKVAAKRLAESLDVEGAQRAYELLCLLELRSADLRGALNAARAGLRLARNGASSQQSEMLQLVARVHLAGGDGKRALDTARRSARAAGNGAVAPRLCLAEAAAACGEFLAAVQWVEEALLLAEDAQHALLPRAQRLAGEVLLSGRLPSGAAELLGRAVKSAPEAEEQIRAYLNRGNSRLVVGRPDQAARDFRVAIRLGKQRKDRRLEGLGLGALGTVELLRARQEQNAARLGRAHTCLERAARIARRFKDPYLTATLDDLQKIAAASSPTSTGKAHDVARELVGLGNEVDSSLLVDACVAEVERLATLPQHEPAYAMDPLPLRFSPA